MKNLEQFHYFPDGDDDDIVELILKAGEMSI